MTHHINTPFTVHDETSAPADSRPMLDGAKARLGFISTLTGVMAESPQLLEAYNTAYNAFMKSSLPRLEKHVVLIAASVENQCEYCVAAHSTMAAKARLSDEDLAAVRSQQPVDEPSMEATRSLATRLVRGRGWLDEETIDAFLAAGHTPRHVFDIILGVSVKTMSNYTNHVAHTPLDAAWAARAWQAPAAQGDALNHPQR